MQFLSSASVWNRLFAPQQAMKQIAVVGFHYFCSLLEWQRVKYINKYIKLRV